MKSFDCRLIAIAIAVLLIAGCRGAGGSATSPTIPIPNLRRAELPLEPMAQNPLHKIKHVVIIIQENRTLENLFYGYPNAKTTKRGQIHTGKTVGITKISLKESWDFVHRSSTFFLDCNGAGNIPGTDCRMNGFDRVRLNCFNPNGCHPPQYPAYSYVAHDQIQPYFDMAHQYVLAAQMFASNFDVSSFTSHQYIIAGKNPNSEVNYPETVWGCPGGPKDKVDKLLPNRAIKNNALVACWTPPTLAGELDDKRLSWAYYAVKVTGGLPRYKCGHGRGPDVTKGLSGYWSAYQAIKGICYGPDWDKDVISPPKQMLTDVSDGNLRTVTWLTPTDANSDHPGNDSDSGPSWVASVVNAIGESKFWDSTAIFIFWDDPGGWFDPEKPHYNPNDPDLGGFRLPLLIISPYAKQGWVSQVHYNHGSILRFIEDRFGLAPLAYNDAHATSPAKDCFDFSKPPRKFVPIKAKYAESYFLHEPDDFRPPDSD